MLLYCFLVIAFCEAARLRMAGLNFPPTLLGKVLADIDFSISALERGYDHAAFNGHALFEPCSAFDALAALQLSTEDDAPTTPDLHPRSVSGWRSLMLAQAQLCFYDKACADSMKPSVVAKLAAQVAVQCEEAEASLKPSSGQKETNIRPQPGAT